MNLYSKTSEMADDLSNYKLQLQQVEVALLTDPENAELLKLKEDIGWWRNWQKFIEFNIASCYF